MLPWFCYNFFVPRHDGGSDRKRQERDSDTRLTEEYLLPRVPSNRSVRETIAPEAAFFTVCVAKVGNPAQGPLSASLQRASKLELSEFRDFVIIASSPRRGHLLPYEWSFAW